MPQSKQKKTVPKKTAPKEALSDLFEPESASMRPPRRSSPVLLIILAATTGFAAGFLGLAVSPLRDYAGASLNPRDPSEQVVVRQQQSVTVTELEQRQDLTERLRSQLVVLVQVKSETIEPALYTNEDILGHGFVLSADGWVVVVTNDLPKPVSLSAFDASGNEWVVEEVLVDELSGISFVKLEADNLVAVDIEPLIETWQKYGLVLATLSLPSGQSRLASLEAAAFTEFSEPALLTEAVVRELIVSPPALSYASKKNSLNGPVFNLAGQLVGVAREIGDELRVMPSDYFAGLISNVLKSAKLARARLGASWISLRGNFGLSEELRQGLTKGAHIESVEKTSPAEKAGLETGDVVLRVNDFELNGGRNFSELVMGARPEDVFIMTVLRNGEEIELIATLKALE